MERKGAERAELAESKSLTREISAELNRLSESVIGAAIEVHRRMGPGFLEATYYESLAIELAFRGIPFRRQVSLPVFYRDQLVGESRLDFLVDDVLVVELKAVEELRQVHRAQVLSYLRAGAFELGLLINFNVPLLVQGLKRVVWTL